MEVEAPSVVVECQHDTRATEPTCPHELDADNTPDTPYTPDADKRCIVPDTYQQNFFQ